MMSARRSAAVAAGFALVALFTGNRLPSAQAAESWPVRPIRLVVPFPPGGGADASARILVPKLGDGTGQQWVVDNRGGAAGNIATEIVASAAPDGYTVLLGFATALTVNPTLYPKLPNIEKTLVPVSKYASAQYVLVVHPTVKASSVAEFIALAKSAPGRLNYSSAGVGSPLHLAAEMFRFRAGVDIVNVAYKGGGPAAAALLAGEVNLLFGSVPATLPHVRAGKMRALASTGPRRLALAPDLPTIAEAGFPGFDVTSWYGLLVPAGTPKAVVSRMFDETLKAVKPADVGEALGRQGLEIETSRSPAAFAAEIRAETASWAKVIKAANIKPE